MIPVDFLPSLPDGEAPEGSSGEHHMDQARTIGGVPEGQALEVRKGCPELTEAYK